MTRATDYVKFFKARYFFFEESRDILWKVGAAGWVEGYGGMERKRDVVDHLAPAYRRSLWKYSVITQWEIRWRFIRCLSMELPQMHVGTPLQKEAPCRILEKHTSDAPTRSLRSRVYETSLSHSKLIVLFPFFFFRHVSFYRAVIRGARNNLIF